MWFFFTMYIQIHIYFRLTSYLFIKLKFCMSERICKINSASQTFNTVYQNVDFFLQDCQRKIRDLAIVVFLHLVENIEYIYFFGGKTFFIMVIGHYFFVWDKLKVFFIGNNFKKMILLFYFILYYKLDTKNKCVLSS